jgi:HAD superfamily hydrolase (TIGR01509 family)
MKTILVDAINAFIDKETGIFKEMHELLEQYPNPKIILTGANDEQMDMFSLNDMPYELFTLKHDPEKTDPEYYKRMLNKFGLTSEEVVYFEHSEEAKKSAESVGIVTHFYDKEKKDLDSLKVFLDENLAE